MKQFVVAISDWVGLCIVEPFLLPVFFVIKNTSLASIYVIVGLSAIFLDFKKVRKDSASQYQSIVSIHSIMLKIFVGLAISYAFYAYKEIEAHKKTLNEELQNLKQVCQLDVVLVKGDISTHINNQGRIDWSRLKSLVRDIRRVFNYIEDEYSALKCETVIYDDSNIDPSKSCETQKEKYGVEYVKYSEIERAGDTLINLPYLVLYAYPYMGHRVLSHGGAQLKPATEKDMNDINSWFEELKLRNDYLFMRLKGGEQSLAELVWQYQKIWNLKNEKRIEEQLQRLKEQYGVHYRKAEIDLDALKDRFYGLGNRVTDQQIQEYEKLREYYQQLVRQDEIDWNKINKLIVDQFEEVDHLQYVHEFFRRIELIEEVVIPKLECQIKTYADVSEQYDLKRLALVVLGVAVFIFAFGVLFPLLVSNKIVCPIVRNMHLFLYVATVIVPYFYGFYYLIDKVLHFK